MLEPEPCPENPTLDQLNLALDHAAELYEQLQSRKLNPLGAFDHAGRWEPEAGERQECCRSIRTPSRAYPYSLMTHCRSLRHVAHVLGVEESALRRHVLARRRRQAQAAAVPGGS